MRGIKCVLSVSAVFILAACGGGGGGGSDNPPPAPPAQNARPTVNAGSDATATPGATVALTGSATDDGPASSLTYQWSSSPDTGVTFSAPTAAASNVTFTTAGTYTLTLTVGDGTQSGTDTLSVVVTAPEQVWPANDDDSDPTFHGWAKVEASTVGMTQGGLDAAEDYATTIPSGNVAPGTTVDPGNGMIVRHGKLVHFWGDIDVRKEMKSVTKSMGGITLGIAYDENKVELENKAVTYMPTFGTPPAENAADAQLITLAQLATHTSGFEKPDGGDTTAITAIIQATPGTQWTYSDAGLNWLADVLTFVYQQDLAALANQRVWSVLGLSGNPATGDDVRWRVNDQRPPTRDGGTLQHRELASGIFANANAMARVGLLFLRKGDWNGTRVLSEDFIINRVRTPLPENAGLPVVPERQNEQFPNAPTDYGILWWTNTSKTMPNVPEDAFWAWGLGEELIVVIPSLDLVIVRNGGQATANGAGRTWNDLGWDGDVEVLAPFLDPIVAATTP